MTTGSACGTPRYLICLQEYKDSACGTPRYLTSLQEYKGSACVTHRYLTSLQKVGLEEHLDISQVY